MRRSMKEGKDERGEGGMLRRMNVAKDERRE